MPVFETLLRYLCTPMDCASCSGRRVVPAVRPLANGLLTKRSPRVFGIRQSPNQAIAAQVRARAPRGRGACGHSLLMFRTSLFEVPLPSAIAEMVQALGRDRTRYGHRADRGRRRHQLYA